MRIRAVPLVAALTLVAIGTGACNGAGLFRQYEYEEEIYLSLDGTATMYVNSSIAALNALRGTEFDANPRASIDRAAVRRYFSTPDTRVVNVATSHRSNRPFVHVRIEVDDVRRLSMAPPFAWSTYAFRKDGDAFIYQETVGAAAGKDVGSVGWNGREIVAFRLHLPSKITWHNTRRSIGRGNILVWEQPLANRLRGAPVELEAHMATESILFRTLWLFGLTFVGVALSFGLVIWWVFRRGPKPAEV